MCCEHHLICIAPAGKTRHGYDRPSVYSKSNVVHHLFTDSPEQWFHYMELVTMEMMACLEEEWHIYEDPPYTSLEEIATQLTWEFHIPLLINLGDGNMVYNNCSYLQDTRGEVS